MDTTRIDQHMWCPSLVGSDRSLLRRTLYDAVEQEDWATMCNVLRDAAKPVGIKKVGERSSLLWKLGQKTCVGKTCVDEELKGEVKKQSTRAAGLVGSMGSVSSRCFEDMRRRIALWKIPKLVRHTTYRRKRLCGESERNKNGDQRR